MKKHLVSLVFIAATLSTQAQNVASTATRTSGGFQAGNGGTANTFYGTTAGKITTGNFNTFIGASAGYDITTGSNNTFIGAFTGADNVGSKNIFIGSFAGSDSYGSNNIYI